jgi:hypothetical protein
MESSTRGQCILYKEMRIMAVKKAFLTYLGHRKWRKVRSSKAPAGKNYLKYAGSRKWKKVSAAVGK